MAEKYYQGEDISIVIEIYDESSLTTKQDLSQLHIDLLLITSKKGNKLLASTDETLEGVSLLIERVSSEQLKLLIPSTTTATLNVGVATIELRVRDFDGGNTSISINSSIVIESSNIGGITPEIGSEQIEA